MSLFEVFEILSRKEVRKLSIEVLHFCDFFILLATWKNVSEEAEKS